MRDLYTALCARPSRRRRPRWPDPDSAYHRSPIGGCSEQHVLVDLRYCADEDYREDWAKQFPEDPLPPHEDPPFDRDRLLPQVDWLA